MRLSFPPFPHRPQPLKHRQHAKAMTIALGILATDGVVLAADSQMTVPGFFKLDQGKVAFTTRRTIDPPSGPSTLIVSGAGAETSLQYLGGQLLNWFGEPSPVPSPSEIDSELRKQVLEFHEHHVTPHGAGTLDVWMIVAALSGNERTLWITDKSACLRQSMFGAVGIGAMYARSLLGRMYAPMDTVRAVLLASFVISQVKQLIDGCGNGTDIVGIKSNKLYYVDRQTTRRLEDLFQQRYSRLEAGLLYEIFGGHIGWSTHPKKVSAETRSIRREVERIIKLIEHPIA
jgi:20S proteasome alpha/beta subunit